MSIKRRDNKRRILRIGEDQRSDGMYMFRYTDLNGKRQSVYSYKLVETDPIPAGKTCDISLREMEKQIERDLNDKIRGNEANNTTVDKLFHFFLELRKDLKKTTQCNYICLYKTHIQPAFGNKAISMVRHSEIQKLYMSMMTEKKLKPSTIMSVHSIVYQIFDIGLKDNLIRYSPAANALRDLRKVTSFEQDKRHALTEEEQSLLVDFFNSDRVYKRYTLLLTVLLGTGVRIGEALGLRWDDCNFRDNTISITHSLLYKPNLENRYEYRISTPKTKSSNRTIPMFEDVRHALLAEKKKTLFNNQRSFSVDGYKNFIFLNSNGKVFTPNAVYQVLQNAVHAYNKQEVIAAEAEGRNPVFLPNLSAHIFRHTFCTRLCENENNIKIVQDVMGHKNISTTMDIYNEATSKKKQTSFKELEGKIKLA